jgi:hypothetical protein
MTKRRLRLAISEIEPGYYGIGLSPTLFQNGQPKMEIYMWQHMVIPQLKHYHYKPLRGPDVLGFTDIRHNCKFDFSPTAFVITDLMSYLFWYCDFLQLDKNDHVTDNVNHVITSMARVFQTTPFDPTYFISMHDDF